MNTTKTIWTALMLATSLALGGCGGADDVTANDGAETGDDAEVRAAQASARIETFEGLDGQHYFHLVAANGEIVLQSEGYASADAAKNGVSSVLENGRRASSFEIREARNGEHYFVLKAANGEIIGVSETYASKSNAERGLSTTQGLVRELASKQPVAAVGGARFETFAGQDGMTYFHMRARNGETVLSSQGYQSMQGAKKGIRSVRENGVDEARFEVLEARDGQFYFRLKAGNGEVIGRSEMYVSKSNAKRGMDTVMALLRSGEAR